MKIVLRTDVDRLGKKGDLLEVADGYARNYLVPRGMAMRASTGVVEQAAAMRRNRETREARERAAAEELAGQLTSRRIQVTVRAGEGGKLFGSVTAADVADALRAQLGVEVDRRRVALDEPLKELGAFDLVVKLHTDVDATVGVDVVAG